MFNLSIITNARLLRQISSPCSSIEEGLQIGEKLKEVVASRLDAIGLSAIQIGIQKRVFIMLAKTHDDLREWVTLVNPKIEWAESETIRSVEGCLSFPGIYVETHRPAQVTIKDIAYEGQYAFYGEEAVVAQHELDHSLGTLFFDRGNVVKAPTGRNEPCFCGSGKKFKHCHGGGT
jgi:peptide deformylase